jgi:hypothetical protein
MHIDAERSRDGDGGWNKATDRLTELSDGSPFSSRQSFQSSNPQEEAVLDAISILCSIGRAPAGKQTEITGQVSSPV